MFAGLKKMTFENEHKDIFVDCSFGYSCTNYSGWCKKNKGLEHKVRSIKYHFNNEAFSKIENVTIQT